MYKRMLKFLFYITNIHNAFICSIYSNPCDSFREFLYSTTLVTEKAEKIWMSEFIDSVFENATK